MKGSSKWCDPLLLLLHSGLWLLLSFPAGVSLPDSWRALRRDRCSEEPDEKHTWRLSFIHWFSHPPHLALFQQTDQPVSAWHDWRTSYQHQEAYQLQNDSECQPLVTKTCSCILTLKVMHVWVWGTTSTVSSDKVWHYEKYDFLQRVKTNNCCGYSVINCLCQEDKRCGLCKKRLLNINFYHMLPLLFGFICLVAQ